MGELKVIDPGFYTSIQDRGRRTARQWGVPFSGAMDQWAMQKANAILKNEEGAAVVEMTLIGGKFLSTHTTQVAVTGSSCNIEINELPVKADHILNLKAGDLLSIGKARSGHFIYLGIAGGFETELVQGSRSQYQGITAKAKIDKYDVLPFSEVDAVSHVVSAHQNALPSGSLQCYPGIEFHSLTRPQQLALLNRKYKISKLWNRMAFQLEELLEHQLGAIESGPVLPGTVQLTPEGRLIVLMRDAQVTGGYPRVLQLTETALSQLSQMRSKDSFGFVVTG